MDTIRKETAAIISLAAPMAASSILESSVFFLNTWMLAQLGANTLAAGALVTTLFSTLMMIVWGTASTSSTLFAHYYGAKDHTSITKLVSISNFFALSIGILVGLILWHADYLLLWLGQPASTINMAKGYFHGLAFASIADIFTFMLFNFLQGITEVTATFWLSLFYVPVNIAANYILMFGKFGLPAMGAAGIGYGTCIAYWLLVFAIIIYILCRSDLRQYFKKLFVFDWNIAKEFLIVGTPTGLTWSLTFIFLFFVASAIGRVSVIDLAAFQIVIQWINLFFIITYCLSKALSIRIGIAMGNKTPERLKSSMFAALIIDIIYVILVAGLFSKFSAYLIHFDLDHYQTHTQAISEVAQYYFILAAIYLFFDTTRFLFTGALLGLKDTLYSLKTGIFTWLIIGIPLIYCAAHYVPNNTRIFWIIMIFCEIIGLLVLARRYWVKAVDQAHSGET